MPPYMASGAGANVPPASYYAPPGAGYPPTRQAGKQYPQGDVYGEGFVDTTGVKDSNFSSSSRQLGWQTNPHSLIRLHGAVSKNSNIV